MLGSRRRGSFFSISLVLFFFPFSVLSVLLAAEIGVYKMSQSSHRPGLEWGSKESGIKHLVLIFVLQGELDAQHQEQRGDSHSCSTSGAGWGHRAAFTLPGQGEEMVRTGDVPVS